MKVKFLRRNLIILTIVIVAVGLIWGTIRLATPEVRTYMMNWTDQQKNFDEAYENSNVVILGKIKSEKVYKDRGVVFTMTDVEPIEVLKGDTRSLYKVLFTGGKLDGVIYQTEAGKLPLKDKVYLFLLKARETEGEYIPIGGYQGLFEVDSNYNKAKNITTDIKIKSFNQMNRLEPGVVGKTVRELVEEKN